MTEYLVKQGEGVCSAILVYMLIEPVSELLDVTKEIFKAGLLTVAWHIPGVA